MTFLPRGELLTIEELDRLCGAFARGVRRIRLTGGEPLVRQGVMALVEEPSAGARRRRARRADAHHQRQSARPARRGARRARRRRVNVSLDSLDPATFARITRRDGLPRVLEGIRAARAAGLAVKLNVGAARRQRGGDPGDDPLAHGQGMELTLIETMPLGEIDGDRTGQYLPLSLLRARLAQRFTMEDLPDRNGGPARYVRLRETGGRLGFITPLTHNFCESCNRVRLTCTGTLYLCLGQEDAADLRAPLRASRAGPGCSTPRSMPPSPASRAATTSSSTAARPGRHSPGT
ncbi:MAG: radical SAM protein [Dongiaceae bacterium]